MAGLEWLVSPVRSRAPISPAAISPDWMASRSAAIHSSLLSMSARIRDRIEGACSFQLPSRSFGTSLLGKRARLSTASSCNCRLFLMFNRFASPLSASAGILPSAGLRPTRRMAALRSSSPAPGFPMRAEAESTISRMGSRAFSRALLKGLPSCAAPSASPASALNCQAS